MFQDYGRTYWRTQTVLTGGGSEGPYNRREVRVPAAAPDANLISSLTGNGRHAPALDIDLPARVVPLGHGYSLLVVEAECSRRQLGRLHRRCEALGLSPRYDAAARGHTQAGFGVVLSVPVDLRPSSTPGHSHLYLGVELAWRDYKRLLRALRDCGVIQAGFYRWSMTVRQTFLRPPGVIKHREQLLGA
jgi:hypothetical protein